MDQRRWKIVVSRCQGQREEGVQGSSMVGSCLSGQRKDNTIRQKMAQLMILAFGPQGEWLRGGQLQLMPHPSEHWTINRLIFHVF